MPDLDKYFYLSQRNWIQDDAPLKLLVKSRQTGFSFCNAYRLVLLVSARDARLDAFISTRDQLQARLQLDDCLHWANLMKIGFRDMGEVLFDRDTNHPAFALQFANGRRIYCLSSNPNALAGKRGHVTLDEFALHPDQRLLYRVAKPVTTWGGQLSLISTHRGTNTLFYQLVRDAQGPNPMGWSLHTVPIQKAVAEGLVERINAKTGRPESRDAFLQRLQAECIDREQWDQEYCCLPSDDNAAFFSHELLDACTDPALHLYASLDEFLAALQTPVSSGSPRPSSTVSASGPPRPIRWGEGLGVRGSSGVKSPSDCAPGPPRPTHLHSTLRTPNSALKAGNSQLSTLNPQLFLGLDVARHRNLCSFDVGEKIGPITCDRLRLDLHDQPFSQIEAILYRLLSLPQLKRACIDNSGLGMQLAEQARERFGWKVEPLTLTGPKKEELAFALRREFEDRTLRLPADDLLRADLRALKQSVTPTGKITFLGEIDDSHCDRTWAKALRQHAARYRPAAVGGILV